MYRSKIAILAIFQKGPGWPCPDSAALKIPSYDFKNIFVFGADLSLERLKSKTRKGPFFYGSIW